MASASNWINPKSLHALKTLLTSTPKTSATLTFFHLLNILGSPWLVWLSGLSSDLRTKGHMLGLWTRSPVGDMQEATDQCISHTSMFLSLSFSLLSPLSKNKWNLKTHTHTHTHKAHFCLMVFTPVTPASCVFLDLASATHSGFSLNVTSSERLFLTAMILRGYSGVFRIFDLTNLLMALIWLSHSFASLRMKYKLVSMSPAYFTGPIFCHSIQVNVFSSVEFFSPPIT